MIKRRSFDKKTSKKNIRRRFRRSKNFGRQNKKLTWFLDKKSDDKNLDDNIFSLISNTINSKNVKKLLVYLHSLSGSVLQNIKPKENIKLTCWQKIQRTIIEWYRPTINDIIKKLYPEQIVQLISGKYTNELRNKLLVGTELSKVSENQITGYKDKFELMFLKSIFGKTILRNIKKFIESLSPDQLVLLINGKYNLKNALYNAFLHTKYPTQKEVEKNKEIIENVENV